MRDINSDFVYVFVRQDLPVPAQMVQVAHAAFQVPMEQFFRGIPSIVVIGMPDTKGLDKVRKKLADAGITSFEFTDPDAKHLGVTAIATEPLDKEQKSVLSNYRLWNVNNNVQAKEATA